MNRLFFNSSAMKRLLFALLALFVSLPLFALEQLCFTAREKNSKIQLYMTTAKPDGFKGFQVSRNNSSWSNYDGTAITLANVGDKVYFRAASGNNKALYKDANTYCRFIMSSGSFDASGCISSLIDGSTPDWPNFSDYQFCALFKGCSRLYAAPFLPTQYGLTPHCYESLFEGCSNLRETPGFGSSTANFEIVNHGVTTACFKNMFKGCSSITELKGNTLGRQTLAASCYEGMFQDCINLQRAPAIIKTNTGDPIDAANVPVYASCYKNMFNGCWNLKTAPMLSCPTMKANCYEGMFKGCRSLENGPDLPATTLASGCYASMFENCTSLTAAPELPAETLVSNCYESMFSGCTNLKYISVAFSDWKEDDDATTNWVYNVAPKGTFMGPAAITGFPIYNKSHVPEGWNTSLPDFLCFTVVSVNQYQKVSITLNSGSNIGFKYRIDKGGVPGTWTLVPGSKFQYSSIQLYNLEVNDKVYFKSTSQNGTLSTSSKIHKFTISNGQVDISGNIMSLIDYTLTRKDVPAYTFKDLFNTNSISTSRGVTTVTSNIHDISDLRLPATELGEHCYENMFRGCGNITVAPVLPAKQLGEACYKAMFQYCNHLVSAPALPATELRNSCYESMFEYCSALPVAPHLPAKSFSYKDKNGNIVNLSDCYKKLFRYCESLHYISVEYTSWSTENTSEWVDHVAETGTFSRPSSLTQVGNVSTSKWPWQTSLLIWENFIWGGEIYGKDAVCFMATTSGVGLTIGVEKYGNVGNVSFSFDTKEALTSGSDGDINFSGDGYQKWSIGGSHLNGAGKSVFISAKSTNGPLYIDENNYVRFFIQQTGGASVEMRGNVLSLLKSDCNVTDVPDNAFRKLFADCSKLKSAPNIPVPSGTIGKHAFDGMFQGCSGLISTPELKATTLSEACYAHMFEDCTGLKFINELPANRLESNCYEYMFKNCDGLTQPTVLGASILAPYCYRGMFEDCDNLIQAPKLEAGIMYPHCYEDMFKSCDNMEAAPELSSTRLATSCYSGMLQGTAITRAPKLPSPVLADYCYQSMFKGCTQLDVAPVLAAKNLTPGCYYGMFEGCTALHAAPELPATRLVRDCYRDMFKNCGSNFNNMKVAFPTWPDDDLQATRNWVYGVANKGAFVCPQTLDLVYGYDKIPLEENDPSKQWVVVNDYLCFTNEQDADSRISIEIPDHIKLVYCTNEELAADADTDPWTEYTSGAVITLHNYGDRLFFKAPGKVTKEVDGVPTDVDYENISFSESSSQYYHFVIPTGSRVSVSGNILSLLKENYTEITTYVRPQKANNPNNNYIFSRLFVDCLGLVDASNLILPTFVSPNCYVAMFYGCKLLTYAPALPANKLANYCYNQMFNGCYSLQVAPSLPATELAEGCYQLMFLSCKELVTAPALPAVNLVAGCYYGMFQGCSSLQKSPKLLAISLKRKCYANMFAYCSKLKQIDVNFIAWNPTNESSGNEPTYRWCYTWGDKESDGDFRCPAELPLYEGGNKLEGSSYVPKGWMPGLNIIATIPDENGNVPTGYTATLSNGKTTPIDHHVTFAADNDADVLNITGEEVITITTPDYARVLKIGIYGTTTDGNHGTAAVIKSISAGGVKTYYSSNDAGNMLNSLTSTPKMEIMFDIDNPGTFGSDQDPVKHTYQIYFSNGFYGKIYLYGESHPYCEPPVMYFDYETNELTLSAEAGASIYYSENESDLTGETISTDFLYDGSPVSMPWVAESNGLVMKTFYAVAINAGKDKSVVNSKVIAGYGPKFVDYCLVEENDGKSLRDAITYAYHASSDNYRVKIFVPDGTYDIDNVDAVGTNPVEIGDYVSLIGESVDHTIIKGSGESVIDIPGHDSYLQDIKVQHKSNGVAVHNFDLNTLKIQIADGSDYIDDFSAPRPNWTCAGDQDQINVTGASCNGSTVHARYPRGGSNPEPTAFLVSIVDESDIVEGYAIVDGNDFYLKTDLENKKIRVRAANVRGGFGGAYNITERTAPAGGSTIKSDAFLSNFKLNGYGYATFSWPEQVRVIGASAYKAKYQNKKVRLEQINDDDIVPANTGVLLFGAPSEPVKFWSDNTGGITKPSIQENDLVEVLGPSFDGSNSSGNYILNPNDGNVYVLNDNKIKKLKNASEGGKIYQYRAYFNFDPARESAASASYRMVFGFWYDDEPEFEEGGQTGVYPITLSMPAIVSLGTYNLSGQKTNKKSGLMIKNGKVVMMK